MRFFLVTSSLLGLLLALLVVLTNGKLQFVGMKQMGKAGAFYWRVLRVSQLYDPAYILAIRSGLVQLFCLLHVLLMHCSCASWFVHNVLQMIVSHIAMCLHVLIHSVIAHCPAQICRQSAGNNDCKVNCGSTVSSNNDEGRPTRGWSAALPGCSVYVSC